MLLYAFSYNGNQASNVLFNSSWFSLFQGVVHTIGGYMIFTATTFKYVFDHHPEDIYWCTADIGWITGHSYLTYGPLANGATSVLVSSVVCGGCMRVGEGELEALPGLHKPSIECLDQGWIVLVLSCNILIDKKAAKQVRSLMMTMAPQTSFALRFIAGQVLLIVILHKYLLLIWARQSCWFKSSHEWSPKISVLSSVL